MCACGTEVAGVDLEDGGKDEEFKPRSKKVHIKFDEDAKEFALEPEQE